MSRRAETLVWERARAKGSNLLVLLVLADCAQHDGRDAWPGVKYMADAARLTVRGVRFVLAKLVADGEIVIEDNVTARPTTAGSRQIIPQWFIHVRCVCDWDGYQAEGKDFPQPEGKVFPPPGKDCPDGGKPATALYKEKILEPDPRTENARARLAFAGTRIDVPKFLHDEFTKQLGANGAALFDLLAWYPRLDTQDDGPIVGDLLAFIRHAFAEETKRVFGSRRVGAPRLAYADWICPHDPPRCTHPSRCQQLQDIAAEKARASA